MFFSEKLIVEVLKKSPDRIDTILTEKIWRPILRGVAKTSLMTVPFIFALCALIGWSLNPAEWGAFLRFVGIFLLIAVVVIQLFLAAWFVDDARAWIKKNGKDALAKV